METPEENLDQSLGLILFWDFARAGTIRRAVLEREFQGAGLEISLDGERTRLHAFTRAFQRMKQRRYDVGTKTHTLSANKIRGNKQRAFAINLAESTGGKSNALTQIGTIWFEEKGPEGMKETPRARKENQSDPFAINPIDLDEFDKLFRYVQQQTDTYGKAYDAELLQRVVVKAIQKMNCIKLRDRGGVWFIPNITTLDPADNPVNAVMVIREIYARLGVGALDPVPVSPGALAAKSLQNSAKRSLWDETQELRKELKEFANKDKYVGESGISKRVERWRDLSNKTKLYANLLGFQADEVFEEVREANQILKVLFAEKVLGQAPKSENVLVLQE